METCPAWAAREGDGTGMPDNRAQFWQQELQSCFGLRTFCSQLLSAITLDAGSVGSFFTNLMLSGYFWIKHHEFYAGILGSDFRCLPTLKKGQCSCAQNSDHTGINSVHTQPGTLDIVPSPCHIRKAWHLDTVADCFMLMAKALPPFTPARLGVPNEIYNFTTAFLLLDPILSQLKPFLKCNLK